MATIEEARKLEAEVSALIKSLRIEIGENNQRILALLARGNPTPEEAKEINDRAAQINQTIENSLTPSARQLTKIIGEGVGFFNRSELGDIKNRFEQEFFSYRDFVGEARANRERMNQLVAQNQAATAEETADKAAADQGPGTTSAGETTAQAQAARDSGATTQNPEVTPAGNTPPVTNAQSSAPSVPTDPQQAPKLPPAEVQGTSVVPTASTSAQPASGTGLSVLQTGATGDITQRYVYKAISCTSKFSRGQFIQELEGSLLQFPVDVIQAGTSPAVPAGTSGTGAGTTAQAQSGSTASQADVRRIDNAIAAAQTPNQSSAETARLAAAGRTPDQSSAETARLAAQAGRVAAGAASNLPLPSVGTAVVNGARSLGSTVGAVNAVVNQPLATTVGQVAQSLVPGQSFSATSFGQNVGVGRTAAGQSGGSFVRTPQVQVQLRDGGTTVVTTADQVLALYAQGRITLESRDRALSQITSLTASQTPTAQIANQPVGYEP